jgi:hypothetical protein
MLSKILAVRKYLSLSLEMLAKINSSPKRKYPSKKYSRS